MFDKIKKRHFRNANTTTFEIQFIDAFRTTFHKKIKPSFQYDILKQNEIVQLTCELIVNLINHEKHVRRIEIIRA